MTITGLGALSASSTHKVLPDGRTAGYKGQVKSETWQPRSEAIVHRALAAISVALALLSIALGLWGFVTVGDGLAEGVVKRRILGVAVLFTVLFATAALTLWRRADHQLRRSPEGRSGLMKIRRGDDWFAETADGKWLRWDALAADWTPAAEPDDPALRSSSRPPAAAPSSATAAQPSLPAAAHLALWTAEAESRRRRKKIRRVRFGFQTGGSFLLAAVLVLLVCGLFAWFFVGVIRFLSELPF